MRKILVTGSSGMLGVDLCAELSRDYDIAGLDIRMKGRGIRCDITDKDKTIKSIKAAKPDLIIHAAAWADVDGCEREPDKAKRINEEGTGNVAVSASELEIPLVYISTDFVFDGRKKTAYTEEDPTNPLNVYAKSKLGGERKVAALNKYIILRTSWMYGANGKNFVDAILDRIKRSEELEVVDDQLGCPTYTKDLAKGIGELVNRLQSQTVQEIYHVCNKGAVSRFDYAKEILKLADIGNVKLSSIKSGQLDRVAKRPAFSVLDNGKFEKATNFTMRPWQEALREYLNGKKEYRKLKKKD